MDNNEQLGAAVCTQAGISGKISKLGDAVCCLDGTIDELTTKLEVTAHGFTKSAQAAIEAQGGSVTKM